MTFPGQIMYDQASRKTIFAEVKVLMRTNLWELVFLSISSQAEPTGTTLYILQILFPFFPQDRKSILYSSLNTLGPFLLAPALRFFLCPLSKATALA
jgi:hypothetical protein